MLCDAHNHYHDARLDPWREEITRNVQNLMVVNGTSESDWPAVREQARHSWVIPSFGLHPWFVKDRSADWKASLERHLDQGPAAIGEIGLDRWIDDPDVPAQEEVFLAQLEIARTRNLPVTIHCLKAWGRLFDLLRSSTLPSCGFLLHSYSGPVEMVRGFTDLGAYFSISGYFAHERKARQRETFRAVPPERLLIETDAPDMLPPRSFDSFGLPVNHPGNIANVYPFVRDFLGLKDLEERVEENFHRLFNSVEHRVLSSGR